MAREHICADRQVTLCQFDTRDLGCSDGSGIVTASMGEQEAEGDVEQQVMCEGVDQRPGERGSAFGQVHHSEAEMTTILLVEDEARVRRVMAEVLRMSGYAVQVSSDAEDAIEEIGRCGIQPQLLITDIMLPGRTGRELARDLRGRLPQLKTILVSGYGENVARMGAGASAELSYLPKPFSATQLVEAVRAALGSGE